MCSGVLLFEFAGTLAVGRHIWLSEGHVAFHLSAAARLARIKGIFAFHLTVAAMLG